jgi:hypothetical protein
LGTSKLWVAYVVVIVRLLGLGGAFVVYAGEKAGGLVKVILGDFKRED